MNTNEKEAFKFEKEGRITFEFTHTGSDINIHIVLDNEKRMGLITFSMYISEDYFDPFPPPKPNYIYIYRINVKEKHQGYGYLLYREALKYAKNKGFKGLFSEKASRSKDADNIWNKLKTFEDKYYDYVDIKDLGVRLKENRNKLIKESESTPIKNKIEEFRKELLLKYQQQIDDLFFHGTIQPDVLYLSSIRIKPEFRRQGIGSEIMDKIKKFADENNLIITLSPEAERGYKKKLDNFYKNHGFVYNTGRKKDYRLSSFFGKNMIRRPTKNNI
jgi:GNAT superfamily N-acetyltransferase